MELPARIIKLRKESGLSQEALAEELGVTRQAVSKWELGQSVPDLENLVKMTDLFEVTTDYLLKGDNRVSARAPIPRPCKLNSLSLGRRAAVLISIGAGILCLFLFMILAFFPGSGSLPIFFFFLSMLLAIVACELIFIKRLRWEIVALTVWAYLFILHYLFSRGTLRSYFTLFREVFSGGVTIDTLVRLGFLLSGALIIILLAGRKCSWGRK